MVSLLVLRLDVGVPTLGPSKRPSGTRLTLLYSVAASVGVTYR